MEPEEELAQLLAQRSTIAALNPAEAPYPQREMPPHVRSWFGGIGMILTESWNAIHYTVRGDELHTALAKRESIKASPDEWQSALATYYLPPNPGDSSAFHYLLRTPVPDRFIINWPELERFWKSDMMQAFFVLYGRFGGSQKLRSPSTKEEITWCDWLRGRNKKAA
jgi:hypothetical protein